MYPEDYHYAKEHEWVKLDGTTATIGITDHAQTELGDIVFLELPEVGSQLASGDILGTVESVKAVSEIYCPLSGEVAEINMALVDTPERLNADPHGEAWLIKLKVAADTDLSKLMDAAAYQKFIAE